MAIIENLKKPAPKWYKIFNAIWSPVENAAIVVLVIYGHGEGSKEMLLYKVVSSTFRQVLDGLLVANED